MFQFSISKQHRDHQLKAIKFLKLIWINAISSKQKRYNFPIRFSNAPLHQLFFMVNVNFHKKREVIADI